MPGDNTQGIHKLELTVQSVSDQLSRAAEDIREIKSNQDRIDERQQDLVTQGAKARVQLDHMERRLRSLEEGVSDLRSAVKDSSRPGVKLPATIAAGSGVGAVGVLRLLEAILGS